MREKSGSVNGAGKLIDCLLIRDGNGCAFPCQSLQWEINERMTVLAGSDAKKGGKKKIHAQRKREKQCCVACWLAN